MSNAGSLSDRTKKELGEMARRQGVRGWETMTKDGLLKALARAKAAKPAANPTRPAPKPVPKSAAKVTKPAPKSAPKARPGANGSVNGTHPTSRISAKPTPKPAPPQQPAAKTPTRPLVPPKPAKSAKPSPRPAPTTPTGSLGSGGVTKDRIFLMVPDPFWLHATWELTHQSVQRAEAALRQDWHGARPIIRLFDVTSTDTTSTSETPLRDIVIHAGTNNWYIDVPQPPKSFRADIGYISRRGDFFVLARSNVVTPPKAGSSEALEVNWNDLDSKKAERILAMSAGFESSGNPELKEMFEERLRRPMGAPTETAFGTGAVLPGSLKKFHFDINAHLVVNGQTDPTAHVTLQNEPVKLRPDGTFTMLFQLPDSRQIIPAVATSADGVEERTIVLAVERNTKHLDPMIHDQMNEN
jgi:hypothetical protein